VISANIQTFYSQMNGQVVKMNASSSTKNLPGNGRNKVWDEIYWMMGQFSTADRFHTIMYRASVSLTPTNWSYVKSDFSDAFACIANCC